MKGASQFPTLLESFFMNRLVPSGRWWKLKRVT